MPSDGDFNDDATLVYYEDKWYATNPEPRMVSFLDHPHELIPMVHYEGNWYSLEQRPDMPSLMDYIEKKNHAADL